MTRINLTNRKTESRNSVTWGRAVRNNAGPLVFAAVLIVCSLAVGCSSDKPQPLTSNNPAPIVQPTNTMATNTVPAPLPEAKPAPKKIVHKRPATLTYTDKTYGVSFAYPRKYALETGDAATALLMASPVPMNFVQPGGVALAAVELPDSVFADTDLSYAFFTVSVNNELTADQCQEFFVPQTLAKSTPMPVPAPTSASTTEPTAAAAVPKPDSNVATQPATPDSKLLLGDLEMHSAEAVAGEGTRQADSKYFHVFQNGACYEFALNLTTNGQTADGTLRHVDREKVFARLETILSTVKLEPEKTVEQTVAKQNIDGGKLDEEKTGAAKTEPAKTESAGNAAAARVEAEKTDAGKVVAGSSDAAKPVTATPADPAPQAPAQ
jgi:hypothetical protein